MSAFADIFATLHWHRPAWLLVIVPLVIAAFIKRAAPIEGGIWREHIDPHLLDALLVTEEAHVHRLSRRWIERIVMIGCIISVIALAGPAWEKTPQPIYTNSAQTIVIADMTLSMHATDLKPSRLVQLKYKLRELLKTLKDGRVGLIAYSGDAHLVTPLTEDNAAIENLINPLAPEIIPSIGSNPERAFDLALEMVEKSPEPTRLMLFTDEILPASGKRIQESLNSSNVRELVSVDIIAVGTPTGSPIQLPSGRFLQDSAGNIVSAPLNLGKLTQFAGSIGARLIKFTDDNSDILQLVNHADKQLNDSEKNESVNQHAQWHDRGGWIALLVIPFFLLIFRRGFVLPCILLMCGFVLPADQVLADDNTSSLPSKNAPDWWSNLWQTPEQRALKHFESGEFEEASNLFEDPSWQGLAHAEGGDFSAAQENFSEAAKKLIETDQQRSAEMLYNKAYSQAFNGEIPEALATLDEALQLRPEFESAETAKSILEDLLAQNNTESENKDSSSEEDPSEEGQPNADQQSSGEDSQGDSSTEKPPKNDSSSAAQQQETGDEEAGGEPQHYDEDTLEPDSQSASESPAADNQSEDNQDQLEQPEEKNGEQEENNIEQDASDSSQRTASQIEESTQTGAEVIQQDKLEAWLNQIEDDPSGLLRRKFEYERSLREQEGTVIVDNENKQLW